MDINYIETYKMDGKISDPRGDPGASRICPGKNDFLIIYRNYPIKRIGGVVFYERRGGVRYLGSKE